MWRAGLQFVENCVADAVRLPSQMRIPKPQRLDVERLQKLFPFQIMLPLIRKTMLAAVQFHIQLRLLAKEIQIVNATGMLAAKLVAAEPSGAQPAPHQFFRPSVVLAKLPGTGDIGHAANLEGGGMSEKFVFDVRPHPSLLPQEKESPLHDSGFTDDRPANPVAGISQDAANVAPSPWGEGRVEGGQANQISQRRRCEIFVVREWDFSKAPAERHHGDCPQGPGGLALIWWTALG